MSDTRAPRSRKDLACTADALAYQKRFGAELKHRVVENGDPFVVAQADTPHEIFHAMDIPLISNQWWSAYISAKRLAGSYEATPASNTTGKNTTQIERVPTKVGVAICAAPSRIAVISGLPGV